MTATATAATTARVVTPTTGQRHLGAGVGPGKLLPLRHGPASRYRNSIGPLDCHVPENRRQRVLRISLRTIAFAERPSGHHSRLAEEHDYAAAKAKHPRMPHDFGRSSPAPPFHASCGNAMVLKVVAPGVRAALILAIEQGVGHRRCRAGCEMISIGLGCASTQSSKHPAYQFPHVMLRPGRRRFPRVTPDHAHNKFLRILCARQCTLTAPRCGMSEDAMPSSSGMRGDAASEIGPRQRGSVRRAGVRVLLDREERGKDRS